MEIEGIVARGLQVLLALGGAYLIATWFVLVVWTYRDIESRSRNVVTQVFSTLLAVFFWIPGVLLYMILRPKETLDEAYQRSLEEEYLLQDLQELPLCPTCNHFVHDDWQLCPHCNTQLREPCHSCAHLVDLRWDICPYCGEEQMQHDRKAHQHESEERAEGWIDPAKIEQRIKAEAVRRGESAHALPMATPATAETITVTPLDQSAPRTVTTPTVTVSDARPRSADERQENSASSQDTTRSTVGTQNSNRDESTNGVSDTGETEIPRKFRFGRRQDD